MSYGTGWNGPGNGGAGGAIGAGVGIYGDGAGVLMLANWGRFWLKNSGMLMGVARLDMSPMPGRLTFVPSGVRLPSILLRMSDLLVAMSCCLRPISCCVFQMSNCDPAAAIFACSSACQRRKSAP